jgi:hypothetical protein
LTFVVLAVLTAPGVLLAAEGQDNRWAQSIFFENDLFNGTDSNYTNGIKYSLISPDFAARQAGTFSQKSPGVGPQDSICPRLKP